MATILLLGNNVSLTEFSNFIGSEHSIDRMTIPLEDVEREEELAEETDPRELLDAVFELSLGDAALKNQSLSIARRMRSDNTILFVNTLTLTATEASARIGGDCPVIGISFVPSLTAASDVIEIAPALQTSQADLQRAKSLIQSLTKRSVEVVEDRVAMVSARILAMIVNEAAFALMEGVARPADIDMAMRLGTNYPFGPLEWCDRIGAATLVSILEALHREYGEERYRPSVLLKQYAYAGKRFYEPAEEHVA